MFEDPDDNEWNYEPYATHDEALDAAVKALRGRFMRLRSGRDHLAESVIVARYAPSVKLVYTPRSGMITLPIDTLESPLESYKYHVSVWEQGEDIGHPMKWK
jgi:hypothetical protein